MTFTELKIRLMQHGAVFTKAARDGMRHGRFGQISFLDYATTGGVVLLLDQRVYANVPVRFQDTPFRIDREGEAFTLLLDGEALPVSVRILPAPKYALDAVRLADNTPVRELVMTHADRVRISPVHGCSYHCNFCTCNMSNYREIPCQQLDEAFQIALNDPYIRPRHVLISGGTPRENEKSYQWLNEVYRFFPNQYTDLEFDIMLSPRGLLPGQSGGEAYGDFLHYLREECGFRTMSVNLELFDEAYREKHIPEKAAVGKENYYRFIRKAVEIFGENSIRSSLVVGLEPYEATLSGVRVLSELGCLPVLSAFVPAPGTDTANHPAPSPEDLVSLVVRAQEIAADAHMTLGPLCSPCTHNSILVVEGEF